MSAGTVEGASTVSTGPDVGPDELAFATTPLGRGAVRVEVRSGGTATEHRVVVSDAVLARIGLAHADPRAVARATVATLLDLAPGAGVAADLSLVGLTRDLPGFAEELRARLGR